MVLRHHRDLTLLHLIHEDHHITDIILHHAAALPVLVVVEAGLEEVVVITEDEEDIITIKNITVIMDIGMDLPAADHSALEVGPEPGDEAATAVDADVTVHSTCSRKAASIWKS